MLKLLQKLRLICMASINKDLDTTTQILVDRAHTYYFPKQLMDTDNT
jgi:hypothetical protein